MRKEFLNFTINIDSYLCETCYDYVTNVSSETIVRNDEEILFTESVFGDDHYGQIDWFSFYQPALNFFEVKVVTNDEAVNDEAMVLRIQSGSEYSAEYSLILEIEQRVVLALQVNDEDDLPELMKEVFSKVTENCVFTIERNSHQSYEEDDYEDDDEDSGGDLEESDSCNCDLCKRE